MSSSHHAGLQSYGAAVLQSYVAKELGCCSVLVLQYNDTEVIGCCITIDRQLQCFSAAGMQSYGAAVPQSYGAAVS